MQWSDKTINDSSLTTFLSTVTEYFIILKQNELHTNVPALPHTMSDRADIHEYIQANAIKIDLEIHESDREFHCWAKKNSQFSDIREDILSRFNPPAEEVSENLPPNFSELDDVLVVDIGDEFLFSYLISLALKRFNAEVGLLQIYNEDNVMNMAMGFNAADLDQISYKNTPIRKYLDRNREILLIPDTTADKNLTLDIKNAAQIKTMLISPVINKGNMVAMICLVNKNTSAPEKRFDLQDSKLLASMSISMGSSINNALLYQATTELKEFNEEVLENIPAGILTLSTQKETLFMNRYLRDLRLEHQLSEEVLFQHIDIQDHQEFFNREILLQDQNLYLRVSKRFLQIGGRQPIYLFTITDISMEKEFEIQMRRTERLAVAGELIAGIAHEIKNPLTSMKGFTDLLWKRIDDREFVLKFASIVGSEINRLNTIIERFQSFARPQVGEMSEIELSTLVKEMADIVSYNLDRNHIQLVNKVKPGIKIMGTRDLLIQVLINVMLNASQALADHDVDPKKIEISLITEKSTISLCIEDNGPGIDEKMITRIFDPFYTTKPKGSGLGLSISHRIMQEHEGNINIESQKGKYTRIILKFPINGEKVSL